MGVGVNVAMDSDYASAISQPWIDLRSIHKHQGLPSVFRNQLAAALIDEMVLVLNGYDKAGFSNYCDEWQSLNTHAGQMVELRNGNTVHSGICVGVSEAGALVLETAQGRELFHGGEISLRCVHDS